jgi:hypothetical protein
VERLQPDRLAAHKTKADGKTSKSGRKLSGYNVVTSECMKK